MIGPSSPLCITLLFVIYAGAATPQCPPTDPLGYTVHLPHPEDCNQFYRCDHGIAKPERCPAGLHFNAVLQVCDWPYAANCQAGSSSVTSTSTTTVLSTEQTEVVESTTTSSVWSSSSSPKPTTTSTTESSVYPPCPPISEAGVIIRFPHESNCKYYYICDNGYPALYQCRTGYLFSPTQLKCTPNSESDCGTYSTSHLSTASTLEVTTVSEETSEAVPSTSTTIRTTHETTLTAEVTTQEATTSDNSETTHISACPVEDDPNNIIRIPHESVCYYYYLCRNGDPILYQCPNNLHFNPTLKVCQEKDEAGCEHPSSTTPWETEIPTTDITTIDISGTTEEDSSEQTAAVTTQSPEQTSEASAETTENQYTTEHSTETATENSPEGSTSSEATSEGTSGSEPQTTVEQPSNCPTVDDPNVIIRIPHESICFYYYICKSGELVLYQCPDGLHFNATTRICQEKELAGCTLSVSSTTSGTDGTEDLTTTEEIIETTVNPDPTDGVHETTTEDSSEEPTEETSAENTQTTEEDLTTTEEIDETTINPATTEDVAETTSDSSSEEITEGTTIDVEITTAENTEATESHASSTTEDNINLTTVDQPSSCPAVDDPNVIIRIPHESVCYYYYICRNGDPVLYQCPDGLHFNSTVRICQEKELAGCEQVSSTTSLTEGTEGVTTTETPTWNTSGQTTEETTIDIELTTEVNTDSSENQVTTDDDLFSTTTDSIELTTESTTGSEIETTTTDRPSTCPLVDDPNVVIRIPHESVCFYYYICKSGEMVLYQCPDGLHFNSTIRICQEKELAGCDPSLSSTTSLPEVTEDLTTEEIPETTDGVAGTTTTDSSEVTTEETTIDVEITTAENTEATESHASSTTEDNINLTTVDQPSSCPAVDDPNVIIRIPHESVCYYYYICRNGDPVLYQCPDGLHFNSTVRICQEKELAGCEQVSSTTPLTEGTEDVLTTEEIVETTENPDTTESLTETATWNTSGQTTDETTIDIEHTTEGNTDSSENQVTTEDDLFSTTTDSIELTTESTTGNETETTDTTDIETTTTYRPSTCPLVDDPNVVIRIPHESVCFYYYICKSGEMVLYQCPDGLHFNSTIRICQEKELAGCDPSLSSTTSLPEVTDDLTTVEIPETTEGVAETTTTDSSEVTTEETTIDVEITTAEVTEATESHASSTTEDNINLTTVDQPSSCPAVDDPNVIIRIPHESVCYYYYICRNEDPVLYQCPDGLHFNSTVRICQEKELAGCEQVSSTTPLTEVTEDLTTAQETIETSNNPETTEGFIETTSEDPSDGTTVQSTTAAIVQTTEDTENPVSVTTEVIVETTTETQTTVDHPVSCSAVDDPGVKVRIPHECVCNYYYICKNGELVLSQCPEGLHFNATIRVCQKKEFAGCELSESSTTSLAETSE